MRLNNRGAGELRDITIDKRFTKYAEGSVLISFGDTRVICNASIEDSVPSFLKGKGTGWVTAEYSMLPRATHTRSPREAAKGKMSGRTHEIQRLIGRALRAVIDLNALGERTVFIDCDVIQADGGTRTASITGAYVALADAVQSLMQRGAISRNPLREAVAAVSVGIVEGEVRLDLNYEEDSKADVDMNFVMTSSKMLVEVQGTAEANPFSFSEMDKMRDAAWSGIERLILLQQNALSE